MLPRTAWHVRWTSLGVISSPCTIQTVILFPRTVILSPCTIPSVISSPCTIPGCPAPMPASPSLPCSGAACCLRCHRSSSSGAVRSRRRCHEGTETPATGQSRSAPMEVLASNPWSRSAPMSVLASLPWSAPVLASSRQGAGGSKRRRCHGGRQMESGQYLTEIISKS